MNTTQLVARYQHFTPDYQNPDGIPTVVKRYSKVYLLGLVYLDYYVEDRRPDDPNYEFGKYKHHLNIRIGWRRLKWSFRTDYLYEELPYE